MYRSFFYVFAVFYNITSVIKFLSGGDLLPPVFMHIHIQKTAPDDPRRSFMDFNFYFSTTLPPLLAEA